MKNEFNDIHKLKKKFKRVSFSSKNNIEELRKEFEDLFYTPHIPNHVEVFEKEFKGIKTDLLCPEMSVSGRTILYIHGGSFISGSRKSYRSFCASIAHETSSCLYLPEYRLAPEYPFPTALEDLYNVYAKLIETEKIKNTNLILAGDGAGGGLALSLVHYLKINKLPLPVFIFLISPWVDLTCKDESFDINKKKDFVFSKESLLRAAKLYTTENNLTNELVSPLLASFENFPQVFIQCGSNELLLGDSKRLKQKLENSGVCSDLCIYEDMPHLFEALPDNFENSHLAVEAAGKKISEFFSISEE